MVGQGPAYANVMMNTANPRNATPGNRRVRRVTMPHPIVRAL